MSLDDIISKDTKRAPGGRRQGGQAPVVRGGRPAPGGAARNGRPASGGARARAAPYTRGGRTTRLGTGDEDHMTNASVSDVANSSNPLLKVKGDSKPNTVAGAICNVVREARGNNPPSVLATGPNAINQAMKAVAIARKYLLDESKPIDLICSPVFEQDVRSGSNVCFELTKSKPLNREPSEDDLTAKDKTDVYKLAGAIAGRVRDGEEVGVTTKGAVPVLIVVKGIAMAQQYLAEEALSLKFGISIVDLENPEIRDATSTYLHFAIVPFNS